MDNQVLMILKRVMSDTEFRTRIKATLRPEHFPPGAPRTVYKQILEFDGIVTAGMLSEEANALKKSKRVEIQRLLGDVLAASSAMLSEVEYAARKLVEEAVYERVYAGVQKAAAYLSRGDATKALGVVKEIPRYAEELLPVSDRRSSTRNMRELKPIPEEGRYFTGFTRVDELTRGARLGELWLWAAYVGEFKTMSLLTIAHRLMLQGKNALFVSLEMDEEEIKRRLIAMHAHHLGTPVSFDEIECGRFTENHQEQYDAACDDFDLNENYGVIELWQPPLGVTILDVFREVERTTTAMECEVLILDYLQKLAPITKRMKLREELNDTLDAAKKLALEARARKRMWVISGWQTSSEGRRTAEKIGKYDLWNLGETLVSAQNANVVCWSLQTDQNREANELKIGLAKNRNGSLKGNQRYHVAEPRFCWMSAEPVREEAALDTTVDADLLEKLDVFSEDDE